MVPMRGWKTVGTLHEPSRLRVADPRSGPRLCEAPFIAPTHVQFLEVFALHESSSRSGKSSVWCRLLPQMWFMLEKNARIG